MRLALSALAAAALALSAAPAFAGDIIFFHNGKTNPPNVGATPTPDDYAKSKFTVTEENVDKIVYLIEGLNQPQSFPTNSVAKVFHDPSTIPGGLGTGRRLVESGQTAEARDALGDIAKNARLPIWARAEAAYLIAYSYYVEGNASGAAKALSDFEKQHSKSMHVPQALGYRARALMAQGKIEEARSAFASLKSLPGVSDEVKLEADYSLAWIDEQVATAKNDKAGLESALQGYEAVLSQVKGRSGMEAVEGKCLVGRNSCLIGLGKYAEAQASLEKLIDSKQGENPLVRAGAYTMLGRTLILSNPSGGDKGVYKDALFHFQRVVCLYGSEPGAEDYMAESLFRSGQLFFEMRPLNATTDEAKGQARTAVQRARREWSECVSRFPGTSWAAQAKQQLR